MKKHCGKKVLSFVLIIAMTLGMAPTRHTMASETVQSGETQTVSPEENTTQVDNSGSEPADEPAGVSEPEQNGGSSDFVQETGADEGSGGSSDSAQNDGEKNTTPELPQPSDTQQNTEPTEPMTDEVNNGEAETETFTGTQDASETEIGTDDIQESESEKESGIPAETETEIATETESETLTETETETEDETETETATDTKMETETETLTETESETEAEIGVQIAATVTYTKKLEKDQFTFYLKEVDVENGLQLTAKNGADGSIIFDEITYDEPGVYHYRVTQENGGETVDNVKYDGRVYNVYVTVEENEDGLTASVDKGANDVVFANEYEEPVVEKKYKKEFHYSDGRVSITARATEGANFPEDAQIHADYMEPGSAAYEEAVAILESDYVTDDVLDYVLYDIYFTSETVEGRLEPEDGTVSVEMTFNDPILVQDDDIEVQAQEVVHISDGGADVISTQDFQSTDGVSSLSFSSDEFSPFAFSLIGSGKKKTAMISLGEKKLVDIAESLSVDVTTADGKALEGPYSEDQGFKLSLSYTLSESKRQELLREAGDADHVTFTYDLPDGVTFPDGLQASTGPIIDQNGQTMGTYRIENGVVYFDVSRDFLEKNSNIQGTFQCSFKVDKSVIDQQNKATLEFPGMANGVEISFEEKNLTLKKEPTSNNGNLQKDANGDYWVEYIVEVTANSRVTSEDTVLLLDTPGSNLEIDSDSVQISNDRWNNYAYSDCDGVTKSGDGIQISGLEIPAGSSRYIKYRAKIKDPNLDANGDGNVDGLDNSVKWRFKKDADFDHNLSETPGPTVSKSKAGSKINSGKTGQTLHWKVDLNNGDIKADVSGKVYTDTLSATDGNQKYDQESLQIWKDGVDVTTEYRKYVEWKENSFTLTLPDDAGESSFTLTYDTVLKDPAKGEVEVTNTGDFGGESVGSGKGVIAPDTEPKIEKKPVGDVDKSDLSQVWSVTITPPPGGWTNGFEFLDQLSYDRWNFAGFVFDEVFGVQIDGVDSSHYEEPVYSSSANCTDGHDKLSVKFKGQINDTITITMKSKATAQKLQEEKDRKGTGEIPNEAWVGNQSSLAKASYSLKSGIIKEGNAKFDETLNAYVIEWKIYANVQNDWDNEGLQDLGGKEITITDTLPDGLEYVDGSAQYSLERYGQMQSIDPVATKPLTFKVKTNSGKKDVIVITFKTKALNLDVTYNNRVSWSGETEYGSTQKDVTVNSEILKKQGKLITGDASIEDNTTIQYEIKVNERKLDYRQDEDTLVLEDVIPENVRLIGGSVTITTESGDVVPNAGYEYNSDSRVLTVVVPDSTYVIVRYKVTPVLDGIQQDSDGKYQVNISNTVMLKGESLTKSQSNVNEKVAKSSASIQGKAGSLTLQKLDAQDLGKKLEGATFQLYKVTFNPSGDPTDDLVEEKTTDSSGSVKFEGILSDTVYYYVESKAPEGYEKKTDRFYFCYHTAGQQDNTYAELQTNFRNAYPGVTLHTSAGGSMYEVTDYAVGGAIITAKKILQNADLKDYKFDFVLTEMTDQSGTSVKQDGYKETVQNDEDGLISFSEIEYDQVGTHYYQVKESLTNKMTGIVYDEKTYVVTVKVTKGTTGRLMADVEYPSGLDDGIKFINTVEKGDLTVSKTVTGNAGETEKEFHFTVTLSDTTISGTYGGMTFTDGKAEFTLKHGESKTATGLPAGITYTVTEKEANDDGYTTESTNPTGIIPEGGKITAKFTNSKSTFGDLIVSKEVTGNAGETEKEFHFTVILSDTTVNGTFGDMTFTDGVAEFTLKDGESAKAEKLPAGITYTVTEVDANQDGYTTTKTGETGTITANGTAEAEFTNSKSTFGDLTVSKTVTGNAEDKTKAFHFTVTLSDTTISDTYGDMEFKDGVAEFTLKDGESAKAEKLPAGITYTVTEAEANQDGYTTTKTGETGTITANGTAEAEFTNSKSTFGDLTVSKTVTGNAGDKTKAFHFTVTLSDTTISGIYGDMTFTNGKAEFTLEHGESKTATGLPAGITYEVEEQEADQDGYTTESTNRTGTIPEGGKIAAEFTNSKSTFGDLEVTKTVTGGGDTAKEFHFTVTLDDSITGTYGDMEFTDGVAEFTLKHGETKTATGLPAGITYEVEEEEADQDGYKTSATGTKGTIAEGETSKAEFINDLPETETETTETETESTTPETESTTPETESTTPETESTATETVSTTTETEATTPQTESTTETESTTPATVPATTPETTNESWSIPSYPSEEGGGDDEGVLGSVRNSIGGVLGAMRGVLGAVRTGDDSVMLALIYIVIIGAATAAIVIVVVRRKRKDLQNR